MQPESLPPFRSVRRRLAACAISLPGCSTRPAGKPSRQQPRQSQPHPWSGQATNASSPQPPPERHLRAVSPFVTFLHFQNRVTKRDKSCQKVPKSVIRLLRNDGSGHFCRGVSPSSGLRLPSLPPGEKVRMRGRSQSTGRPYLSFLQIRSSLVWFGLVWSSPGTPTPPIGWPGLGRQTGWPAPMPLPLGGRSPGGAPKHGRQKRQNATNCAKTRQIGSRTVFVSGFDRNSTIGAL